MSRIWFLVLSAVALVGTVVLSRLAARRQRRARRGLATADADGVYAFTHPRCPHCHALIQRLRSHGGLDSLHMIDVAQHPQRAAVYGVRSVPTVVLVRAGRVVESFVGVVDTAVLTAAMVAMGFSLEGGCDETEPGKD